MCNTSGTQSESNMCVLRRHGGGLPVSDEENDLRQDKQIGQGAAQVWRRQASCHRLLMSTVPTPPCPQPQPPPTPPRQSQQPALVWW